MVRVISLLVLSFARTASADDALPKSAETFEVNGHKAYLYAAPKPRGETVGLVSRLR